jgi:hypothetical protein
MKNNSKKRNRVVLTLIIMLVILTGGGVVYANKEALINRFYLVTKSPRDYYEHVEQYALYRLLSSSSPKITEDEKASAYNIHSQVTLHRKELDSVLDTALDSNLTDLEEFLGIPIQSVSFDIQHASKANNLNETIGIQLNDTKLVTTEIYLDSMARTLSLRFPELSDAYLTKSLGNNNNNLEDDKEQQTLHNRELIEQIIRRYMNLYFNNLGTVTLEKKLPLSLDSIVTECNQLTITFTREEARSLYTALLSTAKSDKAILSLLPSLHINTEEYQQLLTALEQRISEVIDATLKDATLQMILNVDSKGNIVRRELTSFGQSTLGYTLLTKEDYREYEFHLTQVSTDHKLSINGSNREVTDANQGEFTLRLHAPSIAKDPDLSLDVAYEDVLMTIREGRRYVEGSFAFSTDDLGGIQVTSDFKVNEDQQLNTTDFRLGTTSLITIHSTGSPITDYPLSVPEATATQFDSSQYQEYLNTIYPEDYLTALANSLGIDPKTLLQLFSNATTR